MSVGITYTVKNESRLILQAIRVHRMLGCSRFYVFLDGSTDETRAVLANEGDVVLLESERPSYEELPGWGREILDRFETNMDVRKRLNTLTAVRMARQDGIDWLACIDADELVRPAASGDELFSRLHALPDYVDQVLMRNLEVLPVGGATGTPFETRTYFLVRLRMAYHAWRAIHAGLKRVGVPPKSLAWATHVFFQIRSLGALPRRFRDPRSGQVIPGAYFLGYDNFKSIIRTSRAESFSFFIHHWRAAAEKPRSIMLGNVLHYDLPDSDSFVGKFGQRSSGMRFKEFYVRDKLAGIATENSAEVARRFFENEIQLPVTKRLVRMRRLGLVVEVDSISRLLSGHESISDDQSQPGHLT